MNRVINMVKENGYLILILIVAAFLRLFHLDFQSLWVHEIFTMNMSDPSMPSSQFYFEMELREGFPYLYFYLLKGFYFLFGYLRLQVKIVICNYVEIDIFLTLLSRKKRVLCFLASSG